MRKTKVFLSPSDQDNNLVHGGGNEQQYSIIRMNAAARVLRDAGVEVKISQLGQGDDFGGFLASIKESNDWGADIHYADHTNAVAGDRKVSGIQMYCYMDDPASIRLGKAIASRLDPIVPGGWSLQDGSNLGEVTMTYCTAVLGEAGYHDHPADALVIRTKPVEMGEAIGYGILDALGLPATPSTVVTQPIEKEPFMATENDRIVAVLEAQLNVLTKIYNALTPGVEGEKHAGATWLAITQAKSTAVDVATIDKAAYAGAKRGVDDKIRSATLVVNQ